MRQRQVFTPEFKRKAIELLQRGDRSATEIARELGVRRNQLYKWKGAMEPQETLKISGSGGRGGVMAELARVKRELARVTEERDILKRAAVYFARESQ